MSPLYTLDKRLNGPQNRSGCFGEETNLLLRTKIPWTSSPSPSLHTDYTVLASDIFRSVMKGFVPERPQLGVAIIALKTLGEIPETVCTQRMT